jgi:hypothetical protein
MGGQARAPIACALQPGELNARAILPGVIAAATARRPSENGFWCEFQASRDVVLSSIVRMIDAEDSAQSSM